MKRYAIWNKKDPVIVPTGAVYTAEQWVAKHPVAGLDSVVVVCAAGEINGAIFDTLGRMVQMYEAQGCDFSACTTPEEKIEAIEAFEDAREAEAKAAQEAAEAEAKAMAQAELETTERIAAAMEYQNSIAE